MSIWYWTIDPPRPRGTHWLRLYRNNRATISSSGGASYEGHLAIRPAGAAWYSRTGLYVSRSKEQGGLDAVMQHIRNEMKAPTLLPPPPRRYARDGTGRARFGGRLFLTCDHSAQAGFRLVEEIA